MTELRLALFDLDGTLVNSHAHIVAAMRTAYRAVGAEAPAEATILSVVGLSLPRALATLQPELDAAARERMRVAYCDCYRGLRCAAVPPLFDGVGDALSELGQDSRLLLGVATGASRRGLSEVLAHHGIASLFDTIQCADDHPSKPDPSMARAALAEAGTTRGVIIGDTSFDMDMAAAAGIPAIGVGWGHHSVAELEGAGAALVAADVQAMADGIRQVLEVANG